MSLDQRLKFLEKANASGRRPEVWAQDDHNPDLFHLCDGSGLTLSQAEVEARPTSITWLIHSVRRIRKGNLLVHTVMPFDEL